MLKRLLFVTLLSVTLFSVHSFAQSAVYFCKTTGLYGFCYGAKSGMDARECAYTNCVKSGGAKPEVLVWTESKGFGSICLGTDYSGATVIGVAVGFDTQDEADEEARRQCEDQGGIRMRVKERWEDQ